MQTEREQGHCRTVAAFRNGLAGICRNCSSAGALTLWRCARAGRPGDFFSSSFLPFTTKAADGERCVVESLGWGEGEGEPLE